MADSFSSPEPREGPKAGKGFPPWLIAVLIVAAVSVLFISQNRTRVKVDFVLFDREARTWVVILIAMGLGALLAELIRMGLKRRRGSS
jgi:uncharacterized integral membrane protein